MGILLQKLRTYIFEMWDRYIYVHMLYVFMELYNEIDGIWNSFSKVMSMFNNYLTKYLMIWSYLISYPLAWHKKETWNVLLNFMIEESMTPFSSFPHSLTINKVNQNKTTKKKVQQMQHVKTKTSNSSICICWLFTLSKKYGKIKSYDLEEHNMKQWGIDIFWKLTNIN